MLWTIGETRDVLVPGVGDDQDVVLSVTTRAGHAFGQHDHWLDRHDHARFEHRVDVFAEFQTAYREIFPSGAANITSVTYYRYFGSLSQFRKIMNTSQVLSQIKVLR